MKLFSYVLRIDDGAAPNPFRNYCTLTICKPVIMCTAEPGDGVIGTGSKNARKYGKPRDLSGRQVYAMKITDIKPLAEYDAWYAATAPKKIPDIKSADCRRRLGDCVYDFSRGSPPSIRPGVHNEGNRERDLSGNNALISRQFYYFGEHPVHHSDRGCWYCPRLYCGAGKAGMPVSMTGEAHCYENAQAERLNGILKQEYGPGGHSGRRQRRAIREAAFLYNIRRSNAAPGYMTPEERHSLPEAV